MAVTLAQAQVNVQDDVEFAVIDNLRRYSWLLDQIVFDDVVNPTGGGNLTYGYTQLVNVSGAAYRDYNTEFSDYQATRERKTVDLKPFGGKFQLDRILAHLGQRATDELAFQVQQMLISIRNFFQDEMINADSAVEPLGFDGLDKALVGTTTEINATSEYDWTASAINTADAAHEALDALDEFLATIVPSQTGGGTGGQDDLPPGVRAILGNTKSITRVRSIARRAGLYTATKDDLGRQIERYGDWTLVNLGDKNDGSAPIIPIEERDPDGDASTTTGLTDLYAVTFGMDSFHAASVAGKPVLEAWMPDWSTEGAVKRGEMEMGPVAPVLKNTKSAAVLRNVKVQ